MKETQLREFREHYFPEKTITESRALMCAEFKGYGLTERTARTWEQGADPVQPWFVKVANDFDKDGVLK